MRQFRRRVSRLLPDALVAAGISLITAGLAGFDYRVALIVLGVLLLAVVGLGERNTEKEG